MKLRPGMLVAEIHEIDEAYEVYTFEELERLSESHPANLQKPLATISFPNSAENFEKLKDLIRQYNSKPGKSPRALENHLTRNFLGLEIIPPASEEFRERLEEIADYGNGVKRNYPNLN